MNLRPKHISEKEYYALTVENLRAYPAYYPGRGPQGYWETLQQVGPIRESDGNRGYTVSYGS